MSTQKWRTYGMMRLCALMVCVGVLAGCTGMGMVGSGNEAQARAHTELAARYYQVGQVAVAVQEAQIAINSDEGYVPAQTLLALIYAQLHQNALADQHFERALQLSEAQNLSATDLRNSYAWYLCQSERAEQGLSQLSSVLRDPLYGSLDKALVNAAVCAARAGKLDAARTYVSTAIDMHPDFGVAYLYRAHIALSQKQMKDAQADAQMAQKLLGDTAEVLWLQTRMEHAQAQYNRNLAAERLQKNFPSSSQTQWLRTEQWQQF